MASFCYHYSQGYRSVLLSHHGNEKRDRYHLFVITTTNSQQNNNTRIIWNLPSYNKVRIISFQYWDILGRYRYQSHCFGIMTHTNQAAVEGLMWCVEWSCIVAASSSCFPAMLLSFCLLLIVRPFWKHNSCICAVLMECLMEVLGLCLNNVRPLVKQLSSYTLRGEANSPPVIDAGLNCVSSLSLLLLLGAVCSE